MRGERMADHDDEVATLKARLAALELEKNPKSLGANPRARAGAIGCLGVLALLALIVLLATCSGNQEAPKATAPPGATAEAPAVPVPVDVTPPHAWQHRDGQEYGYETVLSEEDKHVGKAAADILMFRYLGEAGGIYTVEQVGNGLRVRASCTNPCDLVRVRTITPFGSTTQRIAFAPDSIIGAALTDAFNGQMDRYRPAKSRPEASPPE
jgi:hypothetical protein